MTVSDPRREIQDLNTLLEVSRRLGATTELIPLLEQITSAAINVLDCERATVFLYDPAGDELFSKVATGTGEIRFSAEKGIAGQCVRSGEIINVADAYADARFNPDIDKTTGFLTRNLLAFPLTGHEGQLVGVLQVLNKRGGPFNAHDESLASTLRSLAGVAVQRQMLLDEYAEKQKLERDLLLARKIQQSLLPDSDPIVDGFEIAGYNEPADATGGDCYDYPPLKGGNIGLLIADATGHGIGPALVVSQFRAMVRALTAAEENIINIICQINDLLDADIPEGMFVTSFVGVLNPADSVIRYVSAGHGPLLLYRRARDEAIELAADTVPLGILSPMEFDPPDSICMEDGDVFLLVTDGFFEWTNPDGEQFGTARIFDLIRHHPGCSASELIALIRRELRTFTRGTPQLDDLTAIVVRKVPAVVHVR